MFVPLCPRLLRPTKTRAQLRPHFRLPFTYFSDVRFVFAFDPSANRHHLCYAAEDYPRKREQCRWTAEVLARSRADLRKIQGHNMDTITVPRCSFSGLLEPPIARRFYKLRVSGSLSRQRSRVRAPSSPPTFQKTYGTYGPKVTSLGTISF
jgi:hypothetical protein